MSATVWTKFYWTDWLSDAGLRRCSIAARGIWMDMLCIAAQHDPIGLVAVNGEKLSEGDIARIAGVDPREASTLINELERNDVFARDRKGTIYSRRMVRDAKKAATARKNGLDGGNPSLRKQTNNSLLDKGKDNHRLKTQEPEAIKPKPVAQPARFEVVSSDREKLDRLEATLRSAAGVENDPSPGLFDLSSILGLIDAGFSLEADIVPVIAARKAAGFKPKGWSYYVQAVRDAGARRAGIASEKAIGGRGGKVLSPEEQRESNKQFLEKLWERDGEIRRTPSWITPQEIEAFVASKSHETRATA